MSESAANLAQGSTQEQMADSHKFEEEYVGVAEC